MPLFDFHLACPLHESDRTLQIRRLFDMEGNHHATEHICATLPGLEEDWQIGVIVGRSGSGKSTLARAAYGKALHQPRRWARNRAVIDCFGDLPTAAIVRALGAVGFSSPPAWLKPFAVLSTGQQFRCELARALLTGGELVVVDEFTSVVDRTVARTCAAAVSRAVRADWFGAARAIPSSRELPRNGEGRSTNICDVHRDDGDDSPQPSREMKRGLKRFVAVTCHRDIIPWLEPDWVLDMDSRHLTRRRLRRPPIHLRVTRAQPDDWPLFKRHHYLSGELHRAASCFIGWIDNHPAVFTAVLAFPHPLRPGWREHRTVCLPDYQGIGIGNAMSEFVASLYVSTGRPYFSTTSHPAMIAHRSRSPLWRMTRKPGVVHPGGASSATPGMVRSLSVGRMTAGFEYIGPPRPEVAQRFGLQKTKQTPERGR